MSGLLDNNEIEALFARAGDGHVTLDSETDNSGGRTRWLRTVDFTRPTKFSTDQERRIRRTLTAFCERVPTRMAAEHRTQLELEVIDIGQFTWSDAFEQVPDGCVYLTLETQPHPGRMLLAAEIPVILTALERMLGGRDTNVGTRELTDIDLMVTERMFGTIVAEMSQAFFEIAEMTFGISSVDTQVETVQVAARSEPTLALTLGARLENVAATMALLIPHQAIAPVAAAFSRREDAIAHHDPSASAAVRHGLSLVDVTLRAEVAHVELPLHEVLSLRPGDVVRLDAEADTEMTIFVDRTPLQRARPGRSGKWRAAQVLGKVEAQP